MKYSSFFHAALVILSVGLAFLASPAVAADQYVVAVGATSEVNEHGECRMVTNPEGAAYIRFISTKTASEWKSFRDNPNGLEMATCGGGSCDHNTWTARESNRVWIGVASSADGAKLVALANGGQIYTSKCDHSGSACESGPVGTACADGAKYAGSVGGVRFYAAANDESGTFMWAQNFAITNATSVTDGLANTNMLVGLTDAASPYEAAIACRAKGAGWYLPSKDEWNVMYTNKTAIGGFSLDPAAYYWSSSDYDGYSAWVLPFSSGSQTYAFKVVNLLVRCVRR